MILIGDGFDWKGRDTEPSYQLGHYCGVVRLPAIPFNEILNLRLGPKSKTCEFVLCSGAAQRLGVVLYDCYASKTGNDCNHQRSLLLNFSIANTPIRLPAIEIFPASASRGHLWIDTEPVTNRITEMMWRDKYFFDTHQRMLLLEVTRRLAADFL